MIDPLQLLLLHDLFIRSIYFGHRFVRYCSLTETFDFSRQVRSLLIWIIGWSVVCTSMLILNWSYTPFNVYPSIEKKLLMRPSFYRFIARFATFLIPILGFEMLPVLLILIKSRICINQILLDLKHRPIIAFFNTGRYDTITN